MFYWHIVQVKLQSDHAFRPLFRVPRWPAIATVEMRPETLPWLAIAKETHVLVDFFEASFRPRPLVECCGHVRAQDPEEVVGEVSRVDDAAAAIA